MDATRIDVQADHADSFRKRVKDTWVPMAFPGRHHKRSFWRIHTARTPRARHFVMPATLRIHPYSIPHKVPSGPKGAADLPLKQPLYMNGRPTAGKRQVDPRQARREVVCHWDVGKAWRQPIYGTDGRWFWWWPWCVTVWWGCHDDGDDEGLEECDQHTSMYALIISYMRSASFLLLFASGGVGRHVSARVTPQLAMPKAQPRTEVGGGLGRTGLVDLTWLCSLCLSSSVNSVQKEMKPNRRNARIRQEVCRHA